jgi:hypothetical protein
VVCSVSTAVSGLNVAASCARQGATAITRAVHGHRAEQRGELDRLDVLTPQRPVALGTVSMLVERAGDLGGDQRLLQGGQEFMG